MTFSAAHSVPPSPREGTRRLHGHNYRVELLLRGPLDRRRGWLLDFADIRAVFDPVAEQLDHSHLNEIPGLHTPSIPFLKRWIFSQVKPALPNLERVVVSILGDLEFTPRRRLEDRMLKIPERLSFTLESAHRLPHLPEGHKCSRLHGHSFHVEAAAGDLDRLVERLQRIHDRLDHRYLNEIEGLENPTSENLAIWIWRDLRTDVPDLSVVAVRESAECACVYRGEES
jgi:6-pyruvoyltetrahydropterin/6-carboxytetrahydropterin synthase